MHKLLMAPWRASGWNCCRKSIFTTECDWAINWVCVYEVLFFASISVTPGDFEVFHPAWVTRYTGISFATRGRW